MELVRAWPMCRAPVTFGGGITITKGGLLLSMSGLKKPEASHQSYLRGSRLRPSVLSSGGKQCVWVCVQRGGQTRAWHAVLGGRPGEQMGKQASKRQAQPSFAARATQLRRAREVCQRPQGTLTTHILHHWTCTCTCTYTDTEAA